MFKNRTGLKSTRILSVILHKYSVFINFISCKLFLKLFSLGYYRVQYLNEGDVQRLKPAIEQKILNEVDRLSLIDDMFALVQAGKADTVEALELMKAFKTKETSYVVWSSIMNCLGKLRIIIANDTELDEKFQAFVVDLLTNVTEHVGWNAKAEEHHVVSLLRSQLLARMGCYGHKATVEEAQKRFHVNIFSSCIRFPPKVLQYSISVTK